VQRQLHRRNIEAFLEAPNEVLYYDICWATGSHMSPQMFEQWMLPEMAQVCDMVHEKPGKYVVFYTLGRIRDLLPVMMEAGPDGVETFEQNEGDITLADSKKLYGDRLTHFGNFDCLVLAFGSVDDAREEAMRCLREGMEGGRYVMATADEVPADTKWDNLQAMVDTAMEHGVY
jgi:uroporphyrinogen decarboxylase